MQCSINQRRLCINNNNYESKMHTKLFGCLVFVILICFCDGMHNKKKVKRKIGSAGDVKNRLHFGNVTEKQGVDSRGFLSHGGIFSLGKVLNFFPVGGERECQPSGFTIARAGICLNPYDCRQRDGKASGDCAHGLGVCCVFEVTCGGTVQNNLTYFMSPHFPELWTGEMNCSIQIEKSHAGIMQLRVDFVHFTIGQPNRLTGECDEDEMVLGEGATNFTLCGQNHGQHIYYTLSSSETREAGELPHSRATPLVVRMRGREMPRLWLLRLAQMPLAQSSPHNCLQFHIENNGTIKTFNYASNGRHLAAQEYRACVRRNIGFCSIRYTPCDNRSFRIGPRGDSPLDTLSTDQMDQIMPVDDEQSQDGEEGSGADPQIDETSSTPQPSIISRIWSYIWPFGGQRARRAFWSWSPYMQHYSEEKVKYYGYGNYVGSGFGRQRCTDRVTIPCENEYFVSSQLFGPGVCDPHHCGNFFCPGVRPQDCRVDTSISPFAVSMHFGAPTFKQNPEENIGMCLRYTQVPCDS